MEWLICCLSCNSHAMVEESLLNNQGETMVGPNDPISRKYNYHLLNKYFILAKWYHYTY